LSEFRCPVYTGKNPKIPDLVKTRWQNVQHETTDKLQGLQSHLPLPVIVAVIFPPEGNMLFIKRP
jgi:hypothetical protein